MKKFTESLVFKIIKKRWKDKDMEKYFTDKAKAHTEKLKNELKNKNKN